MTGTVTRPLQSCDKWIQDLVWDLARAERALYQTRGISLLYGYWIYHNCMQLGILRCLPNSTSDLLFEAIAGIMRGEAQHLEKEQ
jgi:hypothetical protein